MWHDLLLLKKTLKVIDEYFWNSKSKQLNLFNYVCSNFLWKMIDKNERFLLNL